MEGQFSFSREIGLTFPLFFFYKGKNKNPNNSLGCVQNHGQRTWRRPLING
jgi:hypothetical protein